MFRLILKSLLFIMEDVVYVKRGSVVNQNFPIDSFRKCNLMKIPRGIERLLTSYILGRPHIISTRQAFLRDGVNLMERIVDTATRMTLKELRVSPEDIWSSIVK